MIETMKIRKGLVFTLPIEPYQVIVIGKNNKMYVYNIEEGKYALFNMYPLRLKVIKVDKSTVECNTISENNNYMEDGERKIQGYLECDGSIVRISSLEDIKNFITKYGKTVNEISDLELEELTNQKYNANDCITDDCGVTYKNNPLVLLFKPYRRDIENYKIT